MLENVTNLKCNNLPGKKYNLVIYIWKSEMNGPESEHLSVKKITFIISYYEIFLEIKYRIKNRGFRNIFVFLYTGRLKQDRNKLNADTA